MHEKKVKKVDDDDACQMRRSGGRRKNGLRSSCLLERKLLHRPASAWHGFCVKIEALKNSYKRTAHVCNGQISPFVFLFLFFFACIDHLSPSLPLTLYHIILHLHSFLSSSFPSLATLLSPIPSKNSSLRYTSFTLLSPLPRTSFLT